MLAAGGADRTLDTRAAGGAPRRAREMSDTRFAFAVGLPVLVFLVLVVAYPLGYSVWMSLHKIIFFGGYRTEYVGFDNFVRVWNDKSFWWSAWITIRFTAESVALTMLIGLGLGLMLNHALVAGGLIRTLIFL